MATSTWFASTQSDCSSLTLTMMLCTLHLSPFAINYSSFIVHRSSFTRAPQLHTIVLDPPSLADISSKPLSNLGYHVADKLKMTVPMETMPMVNDLGSSSSASNKCETTDMVKIEPTCEFTPPSTPSKPGFSVTDQEQMRVSIFAQYVKHEHEGIYELQEAVATILSKSSPDLLISFLDPEVVTFKAIFKHDKQLVIWRKGNAVFVRSHCFTLACHQLTTRRSAFSKTIQQ